MQEGGRRGRERAAAMRDQVEMPIEQKAADRDRSQFIGVDFPLDGQPREEGDPEAASTVRYYGRVGPSLECSYRVTVE